MFKRVKRVVGVAFIKEGKLLVCKSVRSSKTNSFTLIGGGIKKFEKVYKAAIRECTEEIRNGFTLDKNDLKKITIFTEPAESDPRLKIKMHVFLSKKEIDVNLIPNAEILKFRWYQLDESDEHLSSSIKNYFIPYAKKKGLMY